MTWLRHRLLHCINLSRPHTGKVIFYCVCQSLINPCTSSILRSEREGEDGETETTNNSPLPTLFSSVSVSAPCIYSLCFYSLFLSLPTISLSPFSPTSHKHSTPIAFSFFLLHMEALIFSRGAPTSLKRWWMALARVLISKLKQFGDKTSSSLSYWFSSEFGFSL